MQNVGFLMMRLNYAKIGIESLDKETREIIQSMLQADKFTCIKKGSFHKMRLIFLSRERVVFLPFLIKIYIVRFIYYILSDLTCPHKKVIKKVLYLHKQAIKI